MSIKAVNRVRRMRFDHDAVSDNLVVPSLSTRLASKEYQSPAQLGRRGHNFVCEWGTVRVPAVL